MSVKFFNYYKQAEAQRDEVTAQRDQLLEALRPFADLLEYPDEYKPDSDGNAHLCVSVSDIKIARAAIATAESEGK